MRERDFMSVRRILTALAASALVCGIATPAQAQSAPPKAAAKPSSSKPEAASKPAEAAAKPEAKPAAAAVAGGAEPTLIGQFGTWGAYAERRTARKYASRWQNLRHRKPIRLIARAT